MDPITSIISLVTAAVSRIWPDKTEAGKIQAELIQQQLSAELQIDLANLDLNKQQIQVDKEEANNPNRKWISWREMIGYACAFAVIWTYLLQPVLLFLLLTFNHPITNLPQLDMGQLMFLLCSMLGIGGMKSFEKVKGV